MDVNQAKQRYEDELMGLPNVMGVGVGDSQGKEVIKVFVTHKVPKSALRVEEVIPESVGGYEVEVEAIGPVQAQAAEAD